MNTIKNRDHARIVGALVQAGARWTPVFRRPLDPNGQPMGDPERVGCILGMRYRRGSSSTIKIDVPGIILRMDVPRFEGVLAYNCGEIKARDEIRVQGTAYTIMDVQAIDGLYHILTLQD